MSSVSDVSEISFNATPVGIKLAEVHTALKKAQYPSSMESKEIRVFFQVHGSSQEQWQNLVVKPESRWRYYLSLISDSGEKEQEIGMIALRTLLQKSLLQLTAKTTLPPTQKDRKMIFETAGIYSKLVDQRQSKIKQTSRREYFETHCLEETFTTIPEIQSLLAKIQNPAIELEAQRMYAERAYAIFQHTKQKISTAPDGQTKASMFESLWEFLLSASHLEIPPSESIELVIEELTHLIPAHTPHEDSLNSIRNKWDMIKTPKPDSPLDAKLLAQKLDEDRDQLHFYILELKKIYLQSAITSIQAASNSLDNECLRHIAKQYLVNIPKELMDNSIPQEALQAWFPVVRSMWSHLTIPTPEIAQIGKTIQSLQKDIPPDWEDESRELMAVAERFQKLENPQPMKDMDVESITVHVKRQRQKILDKTNPRTKKFEQWKGERDTRIDAAIRKVLVTIEIMQQSLSEIAYSKDLLDDTQQGECSRLPAELSIFTRDITLIGQSKEDLRAELLLEAKEKALATYDKTIKQFREHQTLFRKMIETCDSRAHTLKKQAMDRHPLQKELSLEWADKIGALKADLLRYKNPRDIEQKLGAYTDEKFGIEYRERELSLNTQSQKFIELSASFSGLQHQLKVLLPRIEQLNITHPVGLISEIDFSLSAIYNQRPKTMRDLLSLQADVTSFQERLSRLQEEVTKLENSLFIPLKTGLATTKARLKDRIDHTKTVEILSRSAESAITTITALASKATQTSELEQGTKILQLFELLQDSLRQGTEAEQQFAGWILYLYSCSLIHDGDADYFDFVSPFLEQAIIPLKRARQDSAHLQYEFREIQALWDEVQTVVGTQAAVQEHLATLKQKINQLFYPDEQFEKVTNWEPLMEEMALVEKRFFSLRETAANDLKVAKDAFSEYISSIVTNAKKQIEALKNASLAEEQLHLCQACAAYRPPALDFRSHTPWLVFWNSICTYASTIIQSPPRSLRSRFDELKKRPDFVTLQQDPRYKAIEAKLRELETPRTEEVQFPPSFDITFKIVQGGRLQVGQWLTQLEAIGHKV